MKQFLYLDTDITNSIIAQSEKGLITNFSNKNEKGTDKSKEILVGLKGKTNANASLFKFAKAEVEGSLELESSSTKSHHETYHEIVNKTLHDAAFDFAYNYIKPKDINLCKNCHHEYGEYVKLNRVFNFVDFTYLEKIVSKGGLIENLKKYAKTKVNNQIKEKGCSLTKSQLKITKKVLTENANQLVRGYDTACDIISILKTLLPYSRMLLSKDGYLIPLEDKYFRINPDNLGFKYGGNITCVGMVTNIIAEESNSQDETNVFADIQIEINKILLSILPTQEKNIRVIHPIAVYYENKIAN